MAASSPTAASSAPLQKAPRRARLMSRNVLFLVKSAQDAQRSCGRSWPGHIGNKTGVLTTDLHAYLNRLTATLRDHLATLISIGRTVPSPGRPSGVPIANENRLVVPDRLGTRP